jgi:endogenous inhibitor of DNA gyrase (YacG/DUF329 family)
MSVRASSRTAALPNPIEQARRGVTVMTTIRVSCPDCGAVDLSPDDIQLKVVRGQEAAVGPDSHYTFRCPTCTTDVAKPADERIARLLTTGGVRMEVRGTAVAARPAERRRHPEAPPEGPSLTADDLIDFHLLLRGEGWFDTLLASGLRDR